jgi:hypothetical protein
MGFLVSVIEQPRLYLASTDWRPRVSRERQAFPARSLNGRRLPSQRRRLPLHIHIHPESRSRP